jgi:hypothetical protein
MMYLLVSQNVSGIIMPIIRRMVQNRQRLWCTALAVLQKTRGEEVLGVHSLGMCILESSTCFEQYYAHPQEVNCINTASGVVTLCKWLACAQVKRGVLSFPVTRPATYRD